MISAMIRLARNTRLSSQSDCWCFIQFIYSFIHLFIIYYDKTAPASVTNAAPQGTQTGAALCGLAKLFLVCWLVIVHYVAIRIDLLVF